MSGPTPCQLVMRAVRFFAVGWLVITALVMTFDQAYDQGWAHPLAAVAAWFVLLGTGVLLARAAGRALLDLAGRRGLLPW